MSVTSTALYQEIDTINNFLIQLRQQTVDLQIIKKRLLAGLTHLCEALSIAPGERISELLQPMPNTPVQNTHSLSTIRNSLFTPLSSQNVGTYAFQPLAEAFSIQRSTWYRPLLTHSADQHAKLAGLFYSGLFDRARSHWRGRAASGDLSNEDGTARRQDILRLLQSVYQRLPQGSALRNILADYQQQNSFLSKESLLACLDACVLYVQSSACSLQSLEIIKPLFQIGQWENPSIIARYLSIPQRHYWFTAKPYETDSLNGFSDLLGRFYTAATELQYRHALQPDRAINIRPPQTTFVFNNNTSSATTAWRTNSGRLMEQIMEVS